MQPASDAATPDATEPPPHVACIDDLPAELLHRCVSWLDESDLAICAPASPSFAAACVAEETWEAFCHRRWPDLDATPLYSCISSWRELHRARAKTPRWREVCVRLDRSLRILAEGGDDWPKRLAPTLAELSVPAAALASTKPPWNAAPEVSAWIAHLAARLSTFDDADAEGAALPPRLLELAAWASSLESTLDEWFELATQHDPHAGVDAVLERRREVAVARTGARLFGPSGVGGPSHVRAVRTPSC